MIYGVAAVALLFGLWWWSRTSELFTVWVRNGQVVRVRGRIPAGLLADIKDVVRKPPVRRGKIRAVKEAEAARLVTSGIDEGRTQRLRNCFRLYTIARLRQAPIVEKPTFWQAVSLASLVAWLFDRRI